MLSKQRADCWRGSPVGITEGKPDGLNVVSVIVALGEPHKVNKETRPVIV